MTTPPEPALLPLTGLGMILVVAPLLIILVPLTLAMWAACFVALADLLIPSRRRRLDGMGIAGALVIASLPFIEVGLLLLIAGRGW